MSPQLSLSLLGGFQVTLDDEPLPELTSRKAQSLLCYLAVTGRPHARPVLAGLLWPDVPETNARANLRKELARLRRELRPYLDINRDTIAIAHNDHFWLDVDAFQTLAACPPHAQDAIEKWLEAVALYEGDFLEGFYVLNAPPFEDWVLLQRGRLREHVVQTLQNLAGAYTRQDNTAQAIETLHQLLALEPWREEAHRKLMRLYAKGGQRGLALAQYETCCRVLRSELDVAVAAETIALAEAIGRGEWARTAETGSHAPQADAVWSTALTPAPPPFLALAHRHRLAATPFAARERQLAELDHYLARALAGHGQMVFVTGEAGSGKTALIGEFIQRSLVKHPTLVPVSGQCNAYNGVGDPFLPFREIVRRLTGDIETQWMTGTLTRDHALRIWRLLPHAVQILLDAGADLLDTFVPSPTLIGRIETFAPDATGVVARLRALQARAQTADGSQRSEQSRIFAACADFFTGLAASQPLLLVLEDLHWSDLSSISLLFHLIRHVHTESAGVRILVIGTYRSEDVVREHNVDSAVQHPLMGVIHEFKREYGDIWLDLDQIEETENRRFLDALIDMEPNRLGESFRRTLFRQTQGHALFTVELLRAMRDRGALCQDDEGFWVEGVALDWRTLPAQVEGVIEKRIGLLDSDLHELLSVACVEGEEFTAQVVAGVLERPVRGVVRHLSQALDKRHRLVRESSERQVGAQRLTRYRFGHALIQHYLYATLSAEERRLLHGEIGVALEALYADERDDAVVQLAYHFVRAEAWPQAFLYLRQSGDKARRSYANEEALTFYTQALQISQHIQPSLDPAAYLPVYEGRALVQLLVTDYDQAAADFKLMVDMARAAGNLSKEGEGLCQLAYIYWLTFSAENTPRVAQYAGKALQIARQTGDQRILAQSLIHLGSVDQVHGHLSAADLKFAEALQISRREGHQESLGHSLIFSSMQAYLQGNYQAAIVFGQEGVEIFGELKDAFNEPRALAFLCQSRWGAGHYRQAMTLLHEGLRMGRERENTFIIGRLLNTLGWFHGEFGDATRAVEYNMESIELGRAAAVSNIEISGLVNLGLDHIALGQYRAAQDCLQPTLERVQQEAFGAHKWRWTMKLLIGLAEVHYRTGDYDQAFYFVEAGLKEARATSSQKYVAQGFALRGKILLAGNQPAAGGCDLKAALEIAEPLHSPALLYPLAHEVSAWYAAQGDEEQAVAHYKKAQHAVIHMLSAIKDDTLQATLLALPSVRVLYADKPPLPHAEGM